MDKHAPLVTKLVRNVENTQNLSIMMQLKLSVDMPEHSKDSRGNREMKLIKCYTTSKIDNTKKSLRIAKSGDFQNLISDSESDKKKNCFQICVSWCTTHRKKPIPEHTSSVALANEFKNYFREKVDKIQETFSDDI